MYLSLPHSASHSLLFPFYLSSPPLLLSPLLPYPPVPCPTLSYPALPYPTLPYPTLPYLQTLPLQNKKPPITLNISIYIKIYPYRGYVAFGNVLLTIFSPTGYLGLFLKTYLCLLSLSGYSGVTSYHLSFYTFGLSGVTSYHLFFYTFGLHFIFIFLYGISAYRITGLLVICELYFPDTALCVIYSSITMSDFILLVNSMLFHHYHYATTCIPFFLFFTHSRFSSHSPPPFIYFMFMAFLVLWTLHITTANFFNFICLLIMWCPPADSASFHSFVILLLYCLHSFAGLVHLSFPYTPNVHSTKLMLFRMLYYSDRSFM